MIAHVCWFQALFSVVLGVNAAVCIPGKPSSCGSSSGMLDLTLGSKEEQNLIFIELKWKYCIKMLLKVFLLSTYYSLGSGDTGGQDSLALHSHGFYNLVRDIKSKNNRKNVVKTQNNKITSCNKCSVRIEGGWNTKKKKKKNPTRYCFRDFPAPSKRVCFWTSGSC